MVKEKRASKQKKRWGKTKECQTKSLLDRAKRLIAGFPHISKLSFRK